MEHTELWGGKKKVSDSSLNIVEPCQFVSADNLAHRLRINKGFNGCILPWKFITVLALCFTGHSFIFRCEPSRMKLYYNVTWEQQIGSINLIYYSYFEFEMVRTGLY